MLLHHSAAFFRDIFSYLMDGHASGRWVFIAGGAAHDVAVGNPDGAPAGAVDGHAFVSWPRPRVGVLAASHDGEARAQGGFDGGAKDGLISQTDVQGTI